MGIQQKVKLCFCVGNFQNIFKILSFNFFFLLFETLFFFHYMLKSMDALTEVFFFPINQSTSKYFSIKATIIIIRMTSNLNDT